MQIPDSHSDRDEDRKELGPYSRVERGQGDCAKGSPSLFLHTKLNQLTVG